MRRPSRRGLRLGVAAGLACVACCVVELVVLGGLGGLTLGAGLSELAEYVPALLVVLAAAALGLVLRRRHRSRRNRSGPVRLPIPTIRRAPPGPVDARPSAPSRAR